MRFGMLVAILATTSAGARHAPIERARMNDNRVAAGTIRSPDPLVLRSGVAYRLRFVNMTVRRPALGVEFRRDSTLLTWRTIAKDGADLRATRQVVGPGRHGIALGETFDVEVKPDTPGDLRLDIRIAGRVIGPIMAVLPVRVVP